jgi:hypothetical protein
MIKFLVSISLVFFSNICIAQNFTFTGIPTVKISEAGIERNVEKIEKINSQNLNCVIKEVDGKFYWETRGNKQLVRIDGLGAFVTFVAVDGSGYVRIVKPNLKEAVSLMSQTERTFDYIEHLLLGLRTVTYYGKSM